MRPYMTEEEARENLHYDSQSGVFTWSVTRGHAKKGDIAGTMNVHGYVQISIRRKLYLAHRLAWLMHYGSIHSEAIVHHKNGNKTDNRIGNLEIISRSRHNKHHNINKGRDMMGRFMGRCETPGGAQ